MRQTLFTIDHFLFEDHWILVAWIALGLAYIAYQFLLGTPKEAFGILPVLLIVAAIIHFVLPRLETMGVNWADPDGPLVRDGLAVRGYGLFLLLAMVIGFGLAFYRCYQIGFDGEKILSLCFWMVVAGIIGARLFYVIQKFDSFADVARGDFIFRLLDMTSGGLVVYGSLIGGMVAAIIYMMIYRMPWGIVADILAPGMAIGLAIGRVGCLMNGCCYGGVCDDPFPGIQFPAASPPYIHQLRSGQLFGIQGDYDEDTNRVTVKSVEAGSIAAQRGIQPQDVLEIILYHERQDDPYVRLRAAKEGAEIDVEAILVGGSAGTASIPVSQLPDRSLKTQPTQIYSAINAGLLCALLWFYYPYRRNDGEVFAWMLILYSITRFLEEVIRRDELGAFGTSLTISQWISFGTLAFGLALMVHVRMKPAA